MRSVAALAIALLLLTACSETSSAPPVPSLLGPRQLELVARPNGWVMRATAESNVGTDQYNGPMHISWLSADKALVRWSWNSGGEYRLVDLTNGTMTRLDGYVEVRETSPDGRHVVADFGVESWLIDLTTGERIFHLPGGGPYETWLSPTLLHVDSDSSSALVYDLATGKETPLPNAGHPAVLLAGREVCSLVHVFEVWCVPVAGGEPIRLTPQKLHPIAEYPGVRMAWDQGRRYLAFTYPAPTSLGARPAGTVLAVASAKPVTYRWANEVAIYDGATGQLDRLPLGGEYLISEMVWSADGTYLALALGRMKRRGVAVTPLDVTELRVLNRATGRMEEVTALPTGVRLRMVTNQGEVVYQKDGKQEPLVAAPGAESQAWAPGLRMLPGPMYGESPEPLAFVGQGMLEARTLEGATYRWEWEGTEPNASHSVGPEAAWIALRFYTPGEVVFLKR